LEKRGKPQRLSFQKNYGSDSTKRVGCGIVTSLVHTYSNWCIPVHLCQHQHSVLLVIAGHSEKRL